MKQERLDKCVRPATMARATLKLILACILTAMPLAASQGTPQIDPGKRAQVDAIVAQMMQEGHYPGIGVAIEYKGAIYEKGYGLADIEHRLPVDADTVFPIGSVTKSFTALAIMQLVEQGKISLDAPLGQYLTDYRGPARDLPIRRLLNHTSGLEDYTEMPEYEDSQPDLGVQGFLAAVEKKPLAFKPGDLFSYTNTGLYLLGMVIERLTGASLATYFEEHIFKPFGMTHSYLAGYEEIIPNRSRGYEYGQNQYENAPQTAASQIFAAGGVLATTDDMLKYRRGVFVGDTTSPAIRRNLLTRDKLNDGTPLDYALGCLIVRDFQGHRKISHPGVQAGYAAIYAYYPDDDLTITMQTNNEYSSIQPYAIEIKLARAMLGIPQPTIVDLPVPAGDLAAFTGDFDSTPFKFSISRYGFVAQDGKLFYKLGGVGSRARPKPLLYQGKGEFVSAADVEFTFQFSQERPKAKHLTYEFFDGVFPCVRPEDASLPKENK